MKPFTSFLVVVFMFSNIVFVQCMNEQLMLQLVNAERSKAGAGPVSLNSAGENVAEGYSDEKSVMAGWMASPGHRDNILNPGFKDAGFAQAGTYWTQDFGSGGSGGSSGNSQSQPPAKGNSQSQPPAKGNSQ
ncbi:18188_t:CDS:2, partial [Dentiscutata erythropus]